jgi:hypothetical protein
MTHLILIGFAVPVLRAAAAGENTHWQAGGPWVENLFQNRCSCRQPCPVFLRDFSCWRAARCHSLSLGGRNSMKTW